MKPSHFIIIAFLLLFVGAGVTLSQLLASAEKRANLAAVFLNDSTVVEFDGVGVTEPPVVYSGNDQPPSAGNTTVIDDVQDFFNTDNNEPDESVVVFNETNTGSSENNTVTTVTTSSAQNSEGNATESIVDADNILTTLLGSQAVSIVVGSNSSGGVGGIGGGGITTIQFFGNRIRDTFRALGIVTLTIPNRDELLQNRARTSVFSQNDFALFVASAVLQDEHLDGVVFANGVLTTKYKAFGRLFGFIPLRYTLTINASFSNGALQQVGVRFPWYSFFLAKGASDTQLRERIESQISENIEGFASDYDVATRAFVGVADVLRIQFAGV